MAKVYIETSFISACVTQRTDAGSMYRRKASLEWWEGERHKHHLFLSTEVITELSHPAFLQRKEAQEVLNLTQNITELPVNDEVLGLANLFVKEKVMPAPIAGDAIHVAVATLRNMDYLLSWNVRHMANSNKLHHLRVICRRVGLMPPEIITPDFLWE